MVIISECDKLATLHAITM